MSLRVLKLLKSFAAPVAWTTIVGYWHRCGHFVDVAPTGAQIRG